MCGKLTNDKGAALVITLGIMALLTMVLAISADRSLLDIEMSYNQLHGEQAFYIADAGVKMGLNELNTDLTWRSGFTDFPFGDGSFSVTVVDSATDSTLADTIVLTSTGQLGPAKAEVEILAVPEEDYPFRHAMYGDDGVDIRNSMVTDSYNSDSGTYAGTNDTIGGDLGSNGTISVNNGGIIGGDVSTSLVGGADIDAGAIVTGDVTDEAPEQEMQIIPQSEYDWAEANNSASSGISGTYIYDPFSDALRADGDIVMSEGVYFFSDIIFDNSANLIIPPGDEVIIYVTGDIELKNNTQINVGGTPLDLIFYSQGDFVLKNSGDIYAVFYNPEGEADLRNSGDFYGSIAAADIVAHNSAGFHYDRILADYSRGLTGVVDLVAWKEL